MNEDESLYWDVVIKRLENLSYPKKIYAHYWKTHDQLIQKWFSLNKKRNLRILKTDMWEEAKSKKFFSYVYSRHNKVIGIDISRIVCSKVKLNKNLRVIQADLANLPFPKNYFDLIISLSTLDHLKSEKLKDIVKDFDKILKSHGSIFLTIDNKHSLFNFLRFFVFKFLFPFFYLERCYSISDIEELLKGSQLKITDIDGIMFFPPFLDQILIGLNSVPKAESFANKISDIFLNWMLKLTKKTENRILFGRYLCFRIEKI